MVKKTLQEIANFFDMAVAVDEDGSVFMHPIMPICLSSIWYNHGDDVFAVDSDIVDYSGDWRESLTLPGSWPKEPKFKAGELVIGKATGAVARWGYSANDEELCRRPTEAEWKILRGE